MEEQSIIARMASWRLHQSLVGKKALNIEAYWPIGKVKPIEKVEVTKDWWQSMQIAQKSIDAKIKHANANS